MPFNTEVYYKTLIRYVLQNPCRAGMVQAVGDYPWSSYHQTLGESSAPDWLVVDHLLSHFGEVKARALVSFAQFVNESKVDDLWENLNHQIFLGDEDFAKQYLPDDESRQRLDEIPKVQKRPAPEPLAYFQDFYCERNAAISHAWLSGGYTMAEIAAWFNVHPSTVSRIVSKPSG